jgi:hypothetical protein
LKPQPQKSKTEMLTKDQWSSLLDSDPCETQ